MGSSVTLRDVVRIAEHVFLVAVIPLQRGLDTNTVLFGREVEYRGVNRRLVAVEVLDEGADAALIFKRVLAFSPLVNQVDLDRIEERQLPEALGQYVVMKLYVREGFRAGLEANCRALALGRSDRGQRRLRLTVLILLLVRLSLTMNGEQQLLGQRVNDRHADAVKTA